MPATNPAKYSLSEFIKARTLTFAPLKNEFCLNGIIVHEKPSVLFLQQQFIEMIFKHRIHSIKPKSRALLCEGNASR